MPSALDRPCASRAQLRPLLLDLALLVAALGCVDIAGITWTAALEARFTHAGDAVVVLNANEFDWRGVRVVIWDPGGTWNANIDTLRAGESLRVALSSLDGESGPFLPRMQPDALVAVIVDDANGLSGQTHGRKLADLPIERQSRQPETP